MLRPSLSSSGNISACAKLFRLDIACVGEGLSAPQTGHCSVELAIMPFLRDVHEMNTYKAKRSRTYRPGPVNLFVQLY
jgi:hypothetical protein